MPAPAGAVGFSRHLIGLVVALGATACAFVDADSDGDSLSQVDTGAGSDSTGEIPLASDAGPDGPATSTDAALPMVDAGPTTPDPCTVSWQSATGDADFEERAGAWSEVTTEGGPAIVRKAGVDLPFSAFNGSWAALVLGYNRADQRLEQVFDVPADATGLRLIGYACWVTTQTVGGGDRLVAELVDEGGTVVETLLDVDDTSAGAVCAWTPLAREATSPHAGQRLTLRIRGTSDDTEPTSFAFDALRLEALRCP